ncbi:hypothetical protein AJ88_23945 [Mesorhizobium amorphae CCBAU 01583]|nr:hypothetical protein AJ88_23945 [Mesorhizobium amorphae CCBAU 01583]
MLFPEALTPGNWLFRKAECDLAFDATKAVESRKNRRRARQKPVFNDGRRYQIAIRQCRDFQPTTGTAKALTTSRWIFKAWTRLSVSNVDGSPTTRFAPRCAATSC